MKIFVIGGIVREGREDTEQQQAILQSTMNSLGGQIARAKHDLIVCSPYKGSADLHVLQGWASVATKERASHRPSVEIHFPDDANIAENVVELLKELAIEGVTFRHPAARGGDGSIDRSYSWLLAQLAALDRCHVVVAIGGNSAGASNLLLQLAASRRGPIFPLGYIGGGAAAFLERYRDELFARLGDKLVEAVKIENADTLLPLIEKLAEQGAPKYKQNERPRFFISYPQERPQEADYVEMALMRQNCDVFRDEHTFEGGKPILAEISENICRADIFIALWCREYACSPWCHDELEQALSLREAGSLRVVLLSLDQTRIVPPKARPLIGYTCHTRQELEARVRTLVDLAKGR
jgi:hypothetical protein